MWWTGQAVGLDFETDHRDPAEARIITAGVVDLRPGGPPVVAEWMAQPEREIHPEAVKIHHITTEHAREHGEAREVVVMKVAACLAAAGPECPVVGQNLSYDLTLLDRELRRLALGRLATSEAFATIGQVEMYLGADLAATFPVLDTLVIDKAVDTFRPGKRQLDHMAAHYGVPMPEGAAHGATADVIAAIRILIAMARRSTMDPTDLFDLYRERHKPREIVNAFRVLGERDLPNLHCAQIRWAREQAEHLRDYWAGLNDPEKDPATVDGRWPIRSLDKAAATVADVLDFSTTEGKNA